MISKKYLFQTLQAKLQIALLHRNIQTLLQRFRQLTLLCLPAMLWTPATVLCRCAPASRNALCRAQARVLSPLRQAEQCLLPLVYSLSSRWKEMCKWQSLHTIFASRTESAAAQHRTLAQHFRASTFLWSNFSRRKSRTTVTAAQITPNKQKQIEHQVQSVF